jgi:lipid-binding SYLF domain-containing protein
VQAGAQEYGYALFFMNEKALRVLTEAAGFDVGVGPSVVVVDEGMGRTLTTVTAKQDIYAFIFGQQGLMAGIGVQGNKITKVSISSRGSAYRSVPVTWTKVQLERLPVLDTVQ